MAEPESPTEADVVRPFPVPLSIPVSPPSDEVVLVTEAVKGPTKRGKIMGAATNLGRFAAGRMLEKVDSRHSEILHHKARVAFVDAAALTVPRFFDELGKPKPNKAVLDGCLAAMRGAGIVVDSVPVSAESRAQQRAEDAALANASPEELRDRIQDRIRRMNALPEGGK